MTVASMSWRVPAHPQEAASTPVRSTSTAQLTLIPPKQSSETRRSWRSSSQTWIKPWRRCELCRGVWRGAAPALSLPDAASASAPLAGVGTAPGTGMGMGTDPAVGQWWQGPASARRGQPWVSWPCPGQGLVALGFGGELGCC
ncbi:hypothetical protein RLOC_00011197 [Lonchura striata]|uniref:Uncharacterized protein n=1 Tax=Lonchura striata TaxID=40157 RepID=A0A218UCX4_9PASE|nr:hypothetical protein RLOC_00011197 [Lonchura striata domestica]